MIEVYKDAKGTGDGFPNDTMLTLSVARGSGIFQTVEALGGRAFSVGEPGHAMAPHWYCNTEALIKHRTLINHKHFNRAGSESGAWFIQGWKVGWQ